MPPRGACGGKLCGSTLSLYSRGPHRAKLGWRQPVWQSPMACGRPVSRLVPGSRVLGLPQPRFLQTERQGSKQARELATVKMNEPKLLTTTWMDLNTRCRVNTNDGLHSYMVPNQVKLLCGVGDKTKVGRGYPGALLMVPFSEEFVVGWRQGDSRQQSTFLLGTGYSLNRLFFTIKKMGTSW